MCRLRDCRDTQFWGILARKRDTVPGRGRGKAGGVSKEEAFPLFPTYVFSICCVNRDYQISGHCLQNTFSYLYESYSVLLILIGFPTRRIYNFNYNFIFNVLRSYFKLILELNFMY